MRCSAARSNCCWATCHGLIAAAIRSVAIGRVPSNAESVDLEVGHPAGCKRAAEDARPGDGPDNDAAAFRLIPDSGAARAAVGGLLSVKPIITVEEGIVVTADQPRTRTKAMARTLELLTSESATEVHILYSPPADAEALREAVLARMPEPAPRMVTMQLIGPVIGAHVGPGAYGAVLVRET